MRNAEQSGYYEDLELPAGIDDMEASDDDAYEATEDDVLDLAMRVATGAKQSLPVDEGTASEDDDDDEEVLWRPMAGTIGDRRYAYTVLEARSKVRC